MGGVRRYSLLFIITVLIAYFAIPFFVGALSLVDYYLNDEDYMDVAWDPVQSHKDATILRLTPKRLNAMISNSTSGRFFLFQPRLTILNELKQLLVEVNFTQWWRVFTLIQRFPSSLFPTRYAVPPGSDQIYALKYNSKNLAGMFAVLGTSCLVVLLARLVLNSGTRFSRFIERLFSKRVSKEEAVAIEQAAPIDPAVPIELTTPAGKGTPDEEAVATDAALIDLQDKEFAANNAINNLQDIKQTNMETTLNGVEAKQIVMDLTLDEVRAKQTTHEGKLADLEDNLVSQGTMLATRGTALEAHNTRLVQLDEKVSLQTTELTELQANFTSHDAKLIELDDEQSTQAATLTRVSGEQSTQQTALTTHAVVLAELRGKYDSQQTDLSEVQGEQTSQKATQIKSDEKAATLESRLEELSAGLINAQETLQQTQGQIKSLQEQSESRQQRIQILEEQSKADEQRFQTAKNESYAYQEGLKVIEDDREAVTKRVEAVEAKCSTVESDLDGLAKHFNAAEQDRDSITNRVETVEGTDSTLLQQQDEVNSRLANLTRQLETAEGTIRTVESDRAKRIGEMDQLDERVKTTEQSISGLNIDLEDEKDRVTKLSSDLKIATDTNIKLAAANFELSLQVERAGSKAKLLVQQNQAFRSDLDSYKSRTSGLEQEAEESRLRLRGLTNRLEMTESDKSRLLSELAPLRLKLSDYVKQYPPKIDTGDVKSEIENVASQPNRGGEADKKEPKTVKGPGTTSRAHSASSQTQSSNTISISPSVEQKLCSEEADTPITTANTAGDPPENGETEDSVNLDGNKPLDNLKIKDSKSEPLPPAVSSAPHDISHLFSPVRDVKHSKHVGLPTQAPAVASIDRNDTHLFQSVDVEALDTDRSPQGILSTSATENTKAPVKSNPALGQRTNDLMLSRFAHTPNSNLPAGPRYPRGHDSRVSAPPRSVTNDLNLSKWAQPSTLNPTIEHRSPLVPDTLRVITCPPAALLPIVNPSPPVVPCPPVAPPSSDAEAEGKNKKKRDFNQRDHRLNLLKTYAGIEGSIPALIDDVTVPKVETGNHFSSQKSETVTVGDSQQGECKNHRVRYREKLKKARTASQDPSETEDPPATLTSSREQPDEGHEEPERKEPHHSCGEDQLRGHPRKHGDDDDEEDNDSKPSPSGAPIISTTTNSTVSDSERLQETGGSRGGGARKEAGSNPNHESLAKSLDGIESSGKSSESEIEKKDNVLSHQQEASSPQSEVQATISESQVEQPQSAELHPGKPKTEAELRRKERKNQKKKEKKEAKKEEGRQGTDSSRSTPQAASPNPPEQPPWVAHVTNHFLLPHQTPTKDPEGMVALPKSGIAAASAMPPAPAVSSTCATPPAPVSSGSLFDANSWGDMENIFPSLNYISCPQDTSSGHDAVSSTECGPQKSNFQLSRAGFNFEPPKQNFSLDDGNIQVSLLASIPKAIDSQAPAGSFKFDLPNHNPSPGSSSNPLPASISQACGSQAPAGGFDFHLPQNENTPPRSSNVCFRPTARAKVRGRFPKSESTSNESQIISSSKIADPHLVPPRLFARPLFAYTVIQDQSEYAVKNFLSSSVFQQDPSNTPSSATIEQVTPALSPLRDSKSADQKNPGLGLLGQLGKSDEKQTTKDGEENCSKSPPVIQQEAAAVTPTQLSPEPQSQNDAVERQDKAVRENGEAKKLPKREARCDCPDDEDFYTLPKDNNDDDDDDGKPPPFGNPVATSSQGATKPQEDAPLHLVQMTEGCANEGRNEADYTVHDVIPSLSMLSAHPKPITQASSSGPEPSPLNLPCAPPSDVFEPSHVEESKIEPEGSAMDQESFDKMTAELIALLSETPITPPPASEQPQVPSFGDELANTSFDSLFDEPTSVDSVCVSPVGDSGPSSTAAPRGDSIDELGDLLGGFNVARSHDDVNAAAPRKSNVRATHKSSPIVPPPPILSPHATPALPSTRFSTLPIQPPVTAPLTTAMPRSDTRSPPDGMCGASEYDQGVMEIETSSRDEVSEVSALDEQRQNAYTNKLENAQGEAKQLNLAEILKNLRSSRGDDMVDPQSRAALCLDDTPMHEAVTVPTTGPWGVIPIDPVHIPSANELDAMAIDQVEHTVSLLKEESMAMEMVEGGVNEHNVQVPPHDFPTQTQASPIFDFNIIATPTPQISSQVSESSSQPSANLGNVGFGQGTCGFGSSSVAPPLSYPVAPDHDTATVAFLEMMSEQQDEDDALFHESIFAQDQNQNYSPEELHLAEYDSGRWLSRASFPNEGTARVAFQAREHRDRNNHITHLYESIVFQRLYANFSTDELRLADYNAGRRLGRTDSELMALSSASTAESHELQAGQGDVTMAADDESEIKINDQQEVVVTDEQQPENNPQDQEVIMAIEQEPENQSQVQGEIAMIDTQLIEHEPPVQVEIAMTNSHLLETEQHPQVVMQAEPIILPSPPAPSMMPPIFILSPADGFGSQTPSQPVLANSLGRLTSTQVPRHPLPGLTYNSPAFSPSPPRRIAPMPRGRGQNYRPHHPTQEFDTSSQKKLERTFDSDGYDAYGYDREGYDDEGLNMDGLDREGYDLHGYDNEGYARDGRNRRGFDRDGRDENGFFDSDSEEEKEVRHRGDEDGLHINHKDPAPLPAAPPALDATPLSAGPTTPSAGPTTPSTGPTSPPCLNDYGSHEYGSDGKDKDGFYEDGFNDENYDRDGFDPDGYNSVAVSREDGAHIYKTRRRRRQKEKTGTFDSHDFSEPDSDPENPCPPRPPPPPPRPIKQLPKSADYSTEDVVDFSGSE